jgi:hypothetical protein
VTRVSSHFVQRLASDLVDEGSEKGRSETTMTNLFMAALFLPSLFLHTD